MRTPERALFTAGPAMIAARCELIELNGLRCQVRHWGPDDAPRLFLLHGWMDVSASFQFVADNLGADWHLIAPDWRGFGGSEWLHRPYWFPDYQVDLDQLLERYSPDEPAQLVGHSMGGIIASMYAGIRPQRVARLVCAEGFGVAATTPEMAPGRLDKWLRQAHQPPAMHRYPDRQRFAARLRRDDPRLSEARAGFLAEHLAAATPEGDFVWAGDPFHRVVNPILYRLDEAMACWRRVTAPVQWVIGAESSFIAEFMPDPADLAARKACFRDFREATLEGAGHMLHHDQPEAFAALIDRFMRCN